MSEHQITGPTLFARYKGRCLCGCNETYEPNAIIGYSREADGWVLVEHTVKV